MRKDAANKITKKGERKLGRMNTKKMIDEMKLNMRSEGRDNNQKHKEKNGKGKKLMEKGKGSDSTHPANI